MQVHDTIVVPQDDSIAIIVKRRSESKRERDQRTVATVDSVGMA